MYEIKIKEMENPIEVLETQGLPKEPTGFSKMTFSFESDTEMTEDQMERAANAMVNIMELHGFKPLIDWEDVEVDHNFFLSDSHSLSIYIG